MEREALNAYLDGLLNLGATTGAFDESELRTLLIEEAQASDDMDELLDEWIWTIQIGPEKALRLKLWLGLSYKNLAQLYRRDPREIHQLLRNQRTQQLPPYSEGSNSLAAAPSFGGLSCFMAEQYLSAWLDLEIDELWALKALHEHLAHCSSCRARATEYRKLQEKILKENISHRLVDEKEWTLIFEETSRHRRKFITKILLSVVSALILLAGLGWFVWSKPEVAPNIYEIKEP